MLALFVTSAWAHKPSDSYLTFTVSGSGSEVSVQWDIALRDIDYAIGLDTNDDGAITWDELRAREVELTAYAYARLQLTNRDAPCALGKPMLLVNQHSDGAYAVLRATATCERDIQTLTVGYKLFFDLDPLHRGLASIKANGTTRTAIFSPERARQPFDLATTTPLKQLLAFVREGVEHIGSGIDHLLFLLALLLPALLARTASGYQPVARLTEALWNVCNIVTAFTLAHSITLSLAALQIVALPSRWVETAIAVSVLLAALNNLYPTVHRRLWLVAFVFGLIHGFGFASVLLDLGLPREILVMSLLGFNVGVELGQLLLVTVFFALAFRLRVTRAYQRYVLPGGSSVIALMAVLWVIERALEVRLLP